MNARSNGRAAHLAITAASLAIRHGVASVATIAAACVLWTVAYLSLFLWAIVSNSGLGGPLAYPGGLVIVAVTAGGACLFLFLPATVSAEMICRRSALPILTQIPVSVAVLAALCSVEGLILRASVAAMPFGTSATGFIVWLFVLSLFPIGFYWWIVQAAPLARRAVDMFNVSRRGHVHGAPLGRG